MMWQEANLNSIFSHWQTMSIDCEPSSSETVTAVVVPSADKGSVQTFFTFQPSSGVNNEKRAREFKGSLPIGNKGVPRLSESSFKLMQPLPPPPTAGLTRSQLLFSIGTAMDIRSLAVHGDTEFYLFMDMRAEFQWTSFAMTSISKTGK